MNFQGKNIGIIGLGESGYWSAKLARSLDYNVFVSDINLDTNHPYIDDLKQQDVEVEVGKHSEKILDCDVIIKSPGIPNKIDIFEKISNCNIPIISEIEFASLLSKVNNICVTGTNGKTTTVSLIFDILSSELNILKSGNIGIPFSKVVFENKLYKENNFDYCILELSSFQLEHSYYLKKEISAILNISVDHMDRYDSFKKYLDTKMKIFENSNFCIYNFDDDQIKERFLSLNEKSFAFSLEKKHGNFYFDNNKIKSKNSNYSLNIDDCKLQGMHNISNFLAAATIAKKVDISEKNIFKAIKNFEGLSHRFEHFLNKDGIDFINDSKSTNIDSAIMALKSINSNIILIMGGIPKEEDFSSILQFKNNIKTVIAYGKAAKSINNSLSKEINVTMIESFEDAVNMSIQCANKGSTVLLSPGCSSFDQFKNFEERGKSFKNIVERFYA
jgi:UDP-N-acetylmuramoylalanine--D-glutamate ligase